MILVIQVVAGILLALFTIVVHRSPKAAWVWYSGAVVDGQRHTNATWFMPSHGDKPVLHHTGHAIRWHHLRRIHRAGIRTGGTFAAYAAYIGLIAATLITGIALTLLASGALGWLGYRAARWLRRYRRYRQWERPTHRSITKELGATPAKLEITYNDDKRPIGAVVGFGEEYVPGDRGKDSLTRVITTKLAIEAPAADWSKLHGKKPEVAFRPCAAPPPSKVSWDDVAAAVEAAAPNALVFGLGVRNAISKVTYSESPHIAIPGPSGGGKSNLAALLLIQEMIRGSLIFNLDPKWISHLWLQGLPNVINAHDIPDLHAALAWLGRELDRRTRAAHASANGTGRTHGSVGPRIIVVCEELNFGMPGLKNHWREIRTKEDPKKSPALEGLSALSCAGRASDMHEYLIAQMLTAESTGARDSTIRGNCGIKAMARWDAPGWNMVVGKHIAMPPQTTAPGRIQLVTGEGVRETQVPYLHLDDKDEAVADRAVAWARELAVSGTVAKIPIGGEYGVPLKLVPASVLSGADFSRPVIEAGQGAETAKSGPIETAEALVPVKLSMMLEQGLIPGMTADPEGRNLAMLRKWSQRWSDWPERRGIEGPAHLYYSDEVVECLLRHRPELQQEDAA